MSLDPGQQQIARLLYGVATRAGLAPQRAREFVAAAYAESELRPSAVNRRSGAGGLYQLLSSGYRQRAQRLGGIFNPQANARAILPDYLAFWRTHPSASPGVAGAAVERSGEGASFYASPLDLLRGLGGAGAPLTPAMANGAGLTPPPGPAPAIGRVGPLTVGPLDRHALTLALTGAFGQNGGINTDALLSGLQQLRSRSVDQAIAAAPASSRPGLSPGLFPGLAPSAPVRQHSIVPVPSSLGAVRVLGGADRQGVSTKRAVILFARKVAGVYGKTLTIATGSNHNEHVAGEPGVVSDHWYGEAADIPASGAQLTQLGQAALIAAGMPPAEARKQTGGVFNVNGYQILFNTRVGGNHFNHLHVGLGRLLGRPR